MLGVLIKIVYNLIISLLLFFLIWFGISTFYTAPQYPTILPLTPCAVSNTSGKILSPPSCSGQNTDYQKQQDIYQKQITEYNRNISIIGLIASILYVCIGVFFYFKLPLFSFGFLFGGLFTFFYALTNAVNSDQKPLQFIVVCVGLFIALVVGYILFLKKKIVPQSESPGA